MNKIHTLTAICNMTVAQLRPTCIHINHTTVGALVMCTCSKRQVIHKKYLIFQIFDYIV